MKTYNNFKDAFNDIKKGIESANAVVIEEVAKEVYKDSKEFTYLDTEDMYNSGKSSNFKKGEIVLKAPQVRWLYYTTWIKPRKNKNARVQWFEATEQKNRAKYLQMAIKEIIKRV